MRLLIIGGVAGGASAASRARRLSESAEITLVERGPDVSFANCGLPYYLGGTITDRDRLLVAKPEMLVNRFALDLRVNTEAVTVDRQRKVVTLRHLLDDASSEVAYDKLILATGAAPLRPPIPGLDTPGIHTLRNLEDTDRIKARLDAGVKRAVVIGAGFIGLEMVESLVHRGIATTLVELQDQVLPPLDREMTTPIAAQLAQHGVDLRLGQSATAFAAATGGGVTVTLSAGETITADLVILGIGVRPENTLAVAAGLDVGPRGGVRVDDHMRTSDPDIYAVGDLVEIRDATTGQPTQVPLAGPANRQGRIAADHIFGRESRFRGVQGTAIVRVFDLVAATTGHSEKALIRSQRPFEKILIHPTQHAGYYPGARSMTIKLLYAPGTGLILGAQIVGEEGVDKKIDVLALAIQARMTVFDLEAAELAYAPPFGSAKDAINMLGFVGSNVARGDSPQIHVEQLEPFHVASAPFVLDVRTPAEFAAGALPGATHIPVDVLRTRLAELPRERPILTYCQAGQRGYVATRLLRQHGLEAVNLAGGYRAYRLWFPS